ncbi:hypothetical protein IWW38_005800 [Coemansia aciculifera]|uniref:Uncharacterized protein n=1 Tax=Coemansia aciculifera TaxID=417176 RepID=A0ACC1LUL6_9FUNG|nr:hypothetical protein IWW38_005800 [Coemansia aciculifera]
MRRVYFVIALCGWAVLMAVQGFTGLVRLPINDKAEHFIEFGVLGVLLLANLCEFLSSRRLAWTAAIAAMAVACIVSEVVQAMLAKGRSFQWGDVVANYLGAAFFFFVAWMAYKRNCAGLGAGGSGAGGWAQAPAEDSDDDELDVELDEIIVALPRR